MVPPVVLEAGDVLAGDLAPQARRLVVGGVHRGLQPTPIEAQLSGQVLPGPLDRLGLEVVAEREVAQHLEEGEVGQVADLVEVNGPEALLHRHQALGRGSARPMK